MFKKILFAADASPACNAAAKTAFELAEKHGADLTLLYVIGDPSCDATFSPGHGGEDKKTQDPDDIERVKGRMKAAYEPLARKHGEPGYEILTGIPSTEVLGYAGRIQADCIIMGAHARQDDPAADRFRGVAGSTMQAVAMKAPCPVLIISRPCETCFWYFNQIVFGTDFSTASMSAFRFAYGMAKCIGCKLHLFHALTLNASQAGVGPGQRSIETQIKQAKEKIEGIYGSQMADFDNYDVAVWEGVPHVELLKFTRETSGDLIVMAHHTHETGSGEGEAMGSTMEQVALRSACPVASIN